MSGTILAANVNRLGATVFNDSTATLFLSLSVAASSASSFTVRLTSGGYYELPNDAQGYVGTITGIWSAANGAARVTEMVA